MRSAPCCIGWKCRASIQQITKNQRGRVEWAAAGLEAAESKFGAMPPVDLAEQILRERGPMKPAELVVAIRETSYRADSNPQKLLAALRNAVRRYPRRFVVGVSGRWPVAN